MIICMKNQNDYRNIQILKMLIEQGKADVNSKTDFVPHNAKRATGRTILHQACFLGKRYIFNTYLHMIAPM